MTKEKSLADKVLPSLLVMAIGALATASIRLYLQVQIIETRMNFYHGHDKESIERAQ